MKNSYLIFFCLIISSLGFSQYNPLSGSWLLESLVIDNTTYNVNTINETQTDDNGDRIVLNFNESSNLTFDTSVCNTKEGLFSLDEFNRSLTIISTSTTLITCGNLGDSDFENLYFGFFKATTNYNYEIACLLSGDSCYLYIYSPNGDEATFWNGQLSTNKYETLNYSIYPNPVKDKLNINTSKNNLTTKIFDLNGKLVQENELNKTKSINVETLKKGFYFIVIEDDLGNIGTQKFVK
ncbi:T9SS type A sorting domain-containing protein [Thalassobellus citreus]|uniref:T9SS type A sorting domain-containing protein n=1 Tax=Thalassobellus citreus TaxID=3367752 RepID=UPI003796EACE